MEGPISDVVILEESSASTPLDGTQLSAKMRDKLQRLDRRRVDASLFKILTDGNRAEGGFAVVCRASLNAANAGIDSEMDGVFAVKMMKIRDGDDVYQVLRRAIREADIIADLYHDNIIELEGFVEDIANGKIWLIFPWAEMGNVRDFVASEDWSIPERIWLINDVACGVEYLHSRKPPFCHGDLKSINILVNAEFRAIITDFGSARRLRNTHDEDEQEAPPAQNPTADETTFSVEFCKNSNTMTFTGTKYTLRWAAPEVLSEEDVGTAADIWSMGWVFYEIMTGSIPFENVQKDAAIIGHIVKHQLPSLKDHDRMSPILSLVSLMMMCWEIASESRPSAQRCRKYVSQIPMCAPRSKQSPSTALEDARRLFREGMMYHYQSDYAKALAIFNDALAGLGDQAKNTQEGADILWGIAGIHRLRSENDEAVALYTEVAQICEEIGDRNGIADAHKGIAAVHQIRGEHDAAVALYVEIVKIYEEIGNRGGKADAQFGLADVHRHRDEYDEAAALYTEVVQIREELGDRGGKTDGLWGLAEVHRLRGDYDEAAALYAEVVQICEEIGDRRGKAGAKRGLAEVHRGRKEYAESLQLFMESSQLCRACDDKLGLAYSLRGIADGFRGQGRFKDATKFYEEAAAVFTEIGLAADTSDVLKCASDTCRKETELPASD